MRGGSAPKTREPRQMRAIATRAALIETVEAIVAARGADAVTTTRVAAEAGTAVGTIYRYFTDRDEMLLAAYDDTAARVMDACRDAIRLLPDGAPMDMAAHHLLDVYLAAAEAIPAYADLHAAMRRLRPIAAERSFVGNRVVKEILEPFFARFAPAANAEEHRLHLIGAVLAALVDLYLAAPGGSERARLREEMEAHLMFMVARAK